jgi:signal transduction histidine kinase/CheY-like chemotaxis protein
MEKSNFFWPWTSNWVIRLIIVIAVLVHASVALVYCFVFLPCGAERLGRLIAASGQIVCLVVIGFQYKITPPVKSWLLPFLPVVIEMGFALAIGSDRILIFFVILWEVTSFCFLYPRGLLIYMGLANALVIPLIAYPGINILGPEFPYYQAILELMFCDLLGFLLYALSRMIQRHVIAINTTTSTFEAVLETTPTYLVIINQKAEVEYISAFLSHWLGLSQQRYALGRPLLDLFNGELRMSFQDIMEQSGSVTKTFEVTVDGKQYWFMLRSILLKEKYSRLIEWMDITPIMEAKNEAESLARAKSAFLANMSHEIRTPMNAIVGMTDLMLSNSLEPEQVARADTIKGAALSLLNIINDILDFSKIDALKMEIIPQPFDFASFINDTVNIINLKAAAAGLAFTTAISKDIPPLINSDEVRLKQCLVNLLTNAVKFTPKGCIQLRAWPEFRQGGELRLYFSVRDTGIGIAADDIKDLFTEFERIDTHKNRSIEGTGLGLAITHRLVDLMGGGMSVESVYGEGSCFSFYVICEGPHQGKLAEVGNPENLRVLCYEPVSYNAGAFRDMLESLHVPGEVCGEIGRVRELLEAGSFTHVFLDTSGKESVVEYLNRQDLKFVLIKEVTQKYDSLIPNCLNRPIMITALADVLNGKKEYHKRRTENHGGVPGSFTILNSRMLVVDDNPVNLAVAKGLLKQYGVTADTAAGGEEALEKVKQASYDIVFMDHMMPGMDGLDTARAIRALGGRFTAVIIIALSANVMSEARDQFLQAGMNDFLAKPIILSELREILQKYLPAEKIVK